MNKLTVTPHSYPRGIELVGGIVIENEQGEILLTQSTKWGDKWVLPGGHIEPGERVLDALVREGEEETGLLLIGIEVFYWGELIDSRDFHRPAHFIFFDAYATTTGGSLKLDQRELRSYQWLEPVSALGLDLGESYASVISAFIKLKKQQSTRA